MPKDDEIQTVKIEIVTPEGGPKPDPVDVVKQLVEHHIAEIMANKDVWLFQPFLQTRRVSYEMLRMQTVPEQRKWSLYFEEWGCVSCGSKAQPHTACGFCRGCYSRTRNRLQAILKRTGRRSETPDFDIRDEVETAQLALGAVDPSTEKLPAGDSARPQFYTTLQVAKIIGVHATTVCRWLAAGKIDSPETLGDDYRWNAQQLEALRAVRARSKSRTAGRRFSSISGTLTTP